MSSIMDSDGEGFKDEDEIVGGYDPKGCRFKLVAEITKNSERYYC